MAGPCSRSFGSLQGAQDHGERDVMRETGYVMRWDGSFDRIDRMNRIGGEGYGMRWDGSFDGFDKLTAGRIYWI